MAILRAQAYVLRTVGFGDSSRIAVLLGRECGKLRVVAKGYRNPKHPCARALEPFRRIEIVYYHRPGRELQIASQADVLAHHDGLERDSTRYCCAWAALELCEKILPDEEPAPQLFDLLERTLAALTSAKGGRAALVFRGFQARASALEGFLPELESCAVCDGDVQAERLFSASAGGFVCRSCAGRGTEAETMSPEAAGLFRFLLRADPDEVARAYELALRPAAVEVAGLLERFLAVHIERYAGLRSLATLHQLRKSRVMGVVNDTAAAGTAAGAESRAAEKSRPAGTRGGSGAPEAEQEARRDPEGRPPQTTPPEN